MKFLIYGENPTARKEALKKICGTKVREHIYADTFLFSEFENNAHSSGLFSFDKAIVLHDVISSCGDVVERVLEIGETSSHTVVFLETEKPDEVFLEQFDPTARFVCTLKSEKKDSFNIFSTSDALLSGNKKNVWLVYQSAMSSDIAPEEVHRILVWQVKSMLLVSRSAGNATGLKPFVESKARKGLAHYSSQKLEQLSRSLVRVHHDARQGADFGILLEHFILTEV